MTLYPQDPTDFEPMIRKAAEDSMEKRRAAIDRHAVPDELDTLAIHLQLNPVQTMWLKTKVTQYAEEAREQAWKDGYEAGQDVANGTLKGMSWAEVKAQLTATPHEGEETV